MVEAKSPYLATPLEDAVDQLQRYTNQRRALDIVDVNEGNEQLFHYAQFVVATCGEQARVGTFSSLAVHYLAWKDTSPVPEAEVAAELGKDGKALSEQEKLVAGMLRPAHLLDIVQHFTLFMEAGGAMVKIVCRYQPFRAVQLAVGRLLTGKTRAQDAEHDRRGGIIWHTQGSGKSLTMVFLIRKMRSHPDLRRFKIVAVTDRRDLEKQLSDTAALTGEVLTRVKAETRGTKTVSSHEVLQEVLRRPGKDLVFAMIQKYRGEVIDAGAANTEGDDEDDARTGKIARHLGETERPFVQEAQRRDVERVRGRGDQPVADEVREEALDVRAAQGRGVAIARPGNEALRATGVGHARAGGESVDEEGLLQLDGEQLVHCLLHDARSG